MLTQERKNLHPRYLDEPMHVEPPACKGPAILMAVNKSGRRYVFRSDTTGSEFQIWRIRQKKGDFRRIWKELMSHDERQGFINLTKRVANTYTIEDPVRAQFERLLCLAKAKHEVLTEQESQAQVEAVDTSSSL